MIRFVPYIVRSALRNRVRTALTILGVGAAVFLMTGLSAILASHETALASGSETLLVVQEDGVF